MEIMDHKAIRRELLEFLYYTYLDDPLRMVEPEPFFALPSVDRKNIIPNIHYLYDRRLVEMMMGYTPPMFSAVRLTPAGIDLVEDRFNFNRQFPKAVSTIPEAESRIPLLLDQLITQGDLSPLNGAIRYRLQADVLYLRDELAQARDDWRPEVIQNVLKWIRQRHEETGGALPAVDELIASLDTILMTMKDKA